MCLLQFRKYRYFHAAWVAVKKKSVSLQSQKSDCQLTLPMTRHRQVVSVSDSMAYSDTASVRRNIVNLRKSHLKSCHHVLLWPLSTLEDIPRGAVQNYFMWAALSGMSSIGWQFCSPKVLCKQLNYSNGNSVIFGSYYTRYSVLCTWW